MILDDLKLIFIHIPKTAGMSISKSFEQAWSLENHKIATYYSEEKYIDYLKYAIVRNPFSRLVSIYNYIKSKHYYKGKSICGPGDELLPFSSWLLYNLEAYEGSFKDNNFNGRAKNRFKKGSSFWFAPQHNWLYDQAGELGVNKILKLENLDEEFKKFMIELNLEIKLYHINKTSNYKKDKYNYRTHYDDYIKDIVRFYYRKDFMLFNYQF